MELCEPKQDLGIETRAPVATTESEDASPAVLFTLQVNLTDILGDKVGEHGVVPLEVVEGANPLATAADFSAQHQLPEQSKNELAVAVMHRAAKCAAHTHLPRSAQHSLVVRLS